MRSSIIAVFTLAALSVSVPALADDAAPEAAPAPAKPPKPKKICRDLQSSTSRIGSGRACRTAEEWDAIDAKGGRQSSSQAVQSRSADHN